MLNRFRCLWTGMAVLLFAGLLCAQAGFIPVAVQKERNDKIKVLSDQLLKTKDTHERVRLRDEMINLDTLMDKKGFSVPFFKAIYDAGMPKDADSAGDVNARLQAVIAFAVLDTDESRVELIKALGDKSDAVQLRVLKGIHDNGINRAWDQVVPLLNDPRENIEVKIWAARTLGKLKRDDQNKASQALIVLLSKSWQELKPMDMSQPDRRSELNTLIEVVGRALEQLTAVEWRPSNETSQLGDSIDKYTEWWNQKQDLPNKLKDARLTVRRDALLSVEQTADRSIAHDLVEFMIQEQQRWASAPETEKAQHLSLLLTANNMLKQISGLECVLTTTSSADDITGAVKKWTDWWANEVKNMK